MNRTVTASAPGKVNLFLSVGRRDDAGFHPLQTIFQAVDLREVVSVVASSSWELSVTGPGAEQVPCDPSNLAWRAAAKITSRPLRIHIHKEVPVAGGMAGGSADAAAALVATNTLLGEPYSPSALQRFARELGADVPFCLLGGTALGVARGDVLDPLPARGEYWWEIYPAAGLSTASVFAKWDLLHPQAPALAPGVSARLLTALATGDLPQVGAGLRNDLTTAALALSPQLSERLRRAGSGAAALMCGSGPSVAALQVGPGRGPSSAASEPPPLRVRGNVPGARIEQ